MVQRRTISGAASLIVPLNGFGDPDWEAFSSLLERTVKLGLRPCINLCASVPALRNPTYAIGAVHQAQHVVNGPFYAGVHVIDTPGEWFNIELYRRQCDAIAQSGGIPVIFPSHGLNALEAASWLAAFADLSRDLDSFVVAEVTAPLSPVPGIRPIQETIGLVRNTKCRGILHISWSRSLEFNRLAAFSNLRRDFRFWSGNERAIDMAMYGPDYMLMTAAMAPDYFALRDRMWAEGNPDVHAVNDTLQYLGNFTSRAPLDAQPHSLLQMLHLRDLIASDTAPAGVGLRPAADVDVLEEILDRFDEAL